MINKITFSNVIGILLENKKKTFTQYRMVQCIFSQYLNDTATSADLIGDGMIQISRWCSGDRPISKDILEEYEENNLWSAMEQDFRTKNHSKSYQRITGSFSNGNLTGQKR